MKRAIPVIFYLLIIIQLNAQNKLEPKAYLGIIQGINFSRVDFEISEIEQEMLSGYRGGLVFSYFSESYAGIQIELNYTEKGWTGVLDSSEFYNGHINYIELPFLTSIRIGKSKIFCAINLGPYFSYQIMNDISSNVEYPLETDNKFEFGFCGGIGPGFHSSIGTLILEGRYFNSLTNFFNTTTTTEFRASRTQSINISLTYLIKIK